MRSLDRAARIEYEGNSETGHAARRAYAHICTYYMHMHMRSNWPLVGTREVSISVELMSSGAS